MNLEPYQIGSPRVLTRGPDGVIICYGPQTYNVLKAHAILNSRGIDPTVVHLITLRPFPEAYLLDLLKGRCSVLTVEEHVPVGGLGHHVATLIASRRFCNPFRMLTIPNRFPDSCFDHAAALKWAGLDPVSIADSFIALLHAAGTRPICQADRTGI